MRRPRLGLGRFPLVGEVTAVTAFLFTDVEGSTRLWERHPATMSTALAMHDQLLRQSIEVAGGRVFSAAGDSFAAAFPSAGEALAAAVEGQRALRSLEVEGEPLRVRMAVHVGPAERRAGDFFGPALNRCARLMAAAHGGQILVSSAVAESDPNPVPGARLLDLGEHRLKDLSRPERIYQLVHPDLIAEFEALRTLEAYRTSLPSFETSFVGRERETAEVLAAVDRHRLVTLTGTGGSGKTRLAAQAASEMLDLLPDGVWFVDLLGASQPLEVGGCFLSSVGPARGSADDEMEAVEEALRDRRVLLVVDNCEHVIDEAARVIDRLLSGCPHLRILATSRQPLGLAGEQLHPVPPLALPGREVAGGLALVLEAPAVQLLVERARSVDPAFRVDIGNAEVTVALCRHLDGIPLAIELAAARLRTMSLEEVAARVDRRFRLLTTPWDRTAGHHQTLRAAIDWSFDLLGPDHARLFLRLGVFEASFTAATAEEVCGAHPLDPLDVAGTLSDLVDHSLVVRVPTTRGSRYRLLETIRAYARERASSHPEDVEAARQAHARSYLGRVDGIERRLYGHEQTELLAELTDDLPDLRAALDYWEEHDPLSALGMATDLGPFWFMQGRGREAIARLSPLRRLAGGAPPGLVARALFEEAQAAWSVGHRDQAEALCREAVVMFGEQEDDAGKASSLSLLGRIVLDRGGEEADSLLQEAAGLASRAGAARWAADALHFLGILHGRRGDRRRALRFHRLSRQAFLAAGDSIGAAYSLGAAGVDLWVLGRRAAALRCVERSQIDHLAFGDRRGAADGFSLLSLFHLALGELSEARRQATKALQLTRETGSPHGMQNAMWAAAALAWHMGESDLARRCLQVRGSLPGGNSLYESLHSEATLAPLESLQPWAEDVDTDATVNEALALLEDPTRAVC